MYALRDEVEAAIKERAPEATDFDVEQAFEYLQKKAFRISIMIGWGHGDFAP
jgi:polyribonucleotide nucleotidyltransferase